MSTGNTTPDLAVSDFLLQVRCNDGSQPSGLGLAGSAGRREVDGDDHRPDPDGFECDITTPARVLQPDGKRVVAELRAFLIVTVTVLLVCES